MAKEKKPQTSAETERTYTNAMDKIRDEMAKTRNSQLQLLGEGMTSLLQMHPELEKLILAKDKTLDGALGAVRKNATGGCSDPVQTTKSLCGYYGIPCENPRALAMEVAVAMMGGEGTPQTASLTAPIERGAETAGISSGAAAAASPSPEGKAGETDPFDLDALLGGL